MFYPDTLVDKSIKINVELVKNWDLFVGVGQVESDHGIASLEPRVKDCSYHL